MGKRITIKDVAAAAQVSNGTVHRALNDKPGVSDAVRERIVAIAREIGYEPNIVASSLKKKPLRVVVAFPGPTRENRFFYGQLWDGYREVKKELVTYNLDVIETPYYDDEVNSFTNNMKGVMRQYHGEIDGVIGGGKLFERDIQTVEKLTGNNIPVVLVSEGMENLNCLCSVQSEHALDGRMAAELLTAQIPGGTEILMCAGDVLLTSNRENSGGFEAYMKENNVNNKLIKLYGYDNYEDMTARIKDVLAHNDNIHGLYSVNARCSLLLAQVVEAEGYGADRYRMVGSDIYPESVDFMKKGIIDLIIDKNPCQQAVVGFRRLVNYLVRHEMPFEKEEYVPSTIICRSNLEKYIKRKGLS